MRLFIPIFFMFFCFNLEAQEHFSVYFDSDKFVLNSTETKRLNDWIATHQKDKIVAINGYTDKDGTSGYNDTLAQNRVNFVFNLVKEKVKIREDFKSRSYGEDFTQDKNKAKNRRVTIYYIFEKDLAKENDILGIKEEVVPVKDSVVVEEIIPDDAPLEVKLSKAKVGDKIRIENINFHLNTFAIMNESRPVLYELLATMRNYPKLVIEIHGHVCCNPNTQDKHSIKLSVERAKAIKLFLLANGIASPRVSFQGFGSSQPIFAIPEKDESERKTNRRVEILVVER